MRLRLQPLLSDTIERVLLDHLGTGSQKKPEGQKINIGKVFNLKSMDHQTIV